jgi:hypothetical protein
MNSTTPERTELVIRYGRRSLALCLVWLGLLGTCLAFQVFDPEGPLTAMANNLLKFLPIGLPIVLVALQASLKGKGFAKNDPDVRAVMEDEFRRANLNKAFRCAFFTVFIIQVPLGLAVWNHPTHVALYFMGGFTVLLGVMALMAFFLFFDRG